MIEGDEDVSAANKLMQDRRRHSRLPARLACVFTHEEVTRPATIIDLSVTGALLTSKFLPPKGSVVTIRVESSPSQKPVVLSGSVVRGSWGISEQGDVSRFGVLFSTIAPGLLGLLQSLISTKAGGSPSEPSPGR